MSRLPQHLRADLADPRPRPRPGRRRRGRQRRARPTASPTSSTSPTSAPALEAVRAAPRGGRRRADRRPRAASGSIWDARRRLRRLPRAAPRVPARPVRARRLLGPPDGQLPDGLRPRDLGRQPWGELHDTPGRLDRRRERLPDRLGHQPDDHDHGAGAPHRRGDRRGLTLELRFPPSREVAAVGRRPFSAPIRRTFRAAARCAEPRANVRPSLNERSFDPAIGGKTDTSTAESRRLTELGRSAAWGRRARCSCVDLGVRLEGDRAPTRSTGDCHTVHRGVYAVGHPRWQLRDGGWRLSSLRGRGAALSHRSAGALWRLRPSARPLIEVTAERRVRSCRGIQPHRGRLPQDEVTIVRGIPVTTVSRTLLDLAAVLPRRQVERAINEAEVQRLADPVPLAALLARSSAPAGRALWPGRSWTTPAWLDDHAERVGGALPRISHPSRPTPTRGKREHTNR